MHICLDYDLQTYRSADQSLYLLKAWLFLHIPCKEAIQLQETYEETFITLEAGVNKKTNKQENGH